MKLEVRARLRCIYIYNTNYIYSRLSLMLAECYVHRMTAAIVSTEFINRAVLSRQQRSKRLLPKPPEEEPWIFPHSHRHYDSLSAYLGSTDLV